jgi:cobalt-zinc-cadmium efflux system outer membrane protein
MKRAVFAGAIVFGWAARVVGALPGETALTLDDAFSIARTRAPTILAARARIDEARGRLVRASVLLRDNPVLETGGGVGVGDRGSFVKAEVGFSQTFELGGRRRARVEAAHARIASATAASDNTLRGLLLDVGRAFFRALYSKERLALARRVERLAADVVRIAEQRLAAGDIALLHRNVASGALSRARAESVALEGAFAAALGGLRAVLGFDATAPLAIRGDLRARRRLDFPEIVAGDRPDIRVFAAEIQEAEAEVRLGKALAAPELGVGVRYERDDGANVVFGTLSLTLPFFERGQGLRREATARARRLRLERDAAARLVRVKSRNAWDTYRRRVAAVLELEKNALPLLESNEALIGKGFSAGAIGLLDVLAVRRESFDVRRAYLDRLLDVAIGGIEIEAYAGVLR